MIDYELPSTGAIDFDPCEDCQEYCRKACPQNAFGEKTFFLEEYGQKELPGRNGVFDRVKCNYQMEIDNANYEEVQIEGQAEPTTRVKYCRKCELTCPVGREKS
jgi:epoxyqueuosine reductase